MSQDAISSFESNKEICEAVGCFAKATTDIAVKISQHQTIFLHLCKNCVCKFQDN
jgi:hypothetical protein